MRTLYLLCTVAFLTSCQNKFETDPALGAWKHVESMNDIGDGDQTYHKADTGKTLLFTAYGTVISNQKVCLGNNYSEATVATWVPSKKEWTIDDCIATYSMDESGDFLTVTYACADACGERFKRMD